MPNIRTLILWGIPILALVEAILNFIAWVVDPRPFGDKIRRILRGALMSVSFTFITYLDQLVALWPALGVYGPGIIWAIAAFLIFAGFLKLEGLIGKAVAVFYRAKAANAPYKMQQESVQANPAAR